jgi:hypothetical protein
MPASNEANNEVVRALDIDPALPRAPPGARTGVPPPASSTSRMPAAACCSSHSRVAKRSRLVRRKLVRFEARRRRRRGVQPSRSPRYAEQLGRSERGAEETLDEARPSGLAQ